MHANPLAGGSRITVVGLGYVGLTTAVCLASLGHRVTGVDHDPLRIDLLRRGHTGLHEPRLTGMLAAVLHDGALRLAATTAGDAEFVILCLPTPMSIDGDADVSALLTTAGDIAAGLPSGCVVVVKSTVPVDTAERLRDRMGRPDIALVSNPEFLREGSAVDDFLHPDRIVVGSADPVAADRVAGLYRELDAPVIRTGARGAELAKYCANAFLAMKLSYANMIADLCERTGANADDVVAAVGADPRIGHTHLRPGPGWGGACLPKDTSALLRLARGTGAEHALLAAAVTTNVRRQDRIASLIAAAVGGSLPGSRVTVLGLAFKAGTNDVRGAPALEIGARLLAAGATVSAHDPVVPAGPALAGLDLHSDPYRAVTGADVVVLITDWAEYGTLNWQRMAGLMRGRVVLDTRAALDRAAVAAAGLTCWAPGERFVQPAMDGTP